jgi:excisionase family DNA binding protein
MTRVHPELDQRSWTDEQLLFTTEEAARALHVGRTAIFKLIKTGELTAIHIGRSCRLSRAELLRYVARHDGSVVTGEPALAHEPERENSTRSDVPEPAGSVASS